MRFTFKNILLRFIHSHLYLFSIHIHVIRHCTYCIVITCNLLCHLFWVLVFIVIVLCFESPLQGVRVFSKSSLLFWLLHSCYRQEVMHLSLIFSGSDNNFQIRTLWPAPLTPTCVAGCNWKMTTLTGRGIEDPLPLLAQGQRMITPVGVCHFIFSHFWSGVMFDTAVKDNDFVHTVELMMKDSWWEATHLLTLPSPAVHEKYAPGNQECYIADYFLPALDCCIFSTSHPVIFIYTSTQSRLNVAFNGFVYLDIRVWFWYDKLVEWIYVVAESSSKQSCQRHCHQERHCPHIKQTLLGFSTGTVSSRCI